MIKQPSRYTRKQLAADAAISAGAFRKERLAPTEAWKLHYTKSREHFAALFDQLGSLTSEGITKKTLAAVYKGNLGEALRYLSGPPISDDDLKVLSEVPTLAPGILATDAKKLKRVFTVIKATIDPYRFPWVVEKRAPTDAEKSAALLASAVLLAAQRMSTARRGDGKSAQEAMVKDYLVEMKYKEVPRSTVANLLDGPKSREFCGEALLAGRKADVILRLNDSRLMGIECKVSNSSTNSVKRLNDALLKANHWTKQIGEGALVPTAVICGVFKVHNLVAAQEAGLTLVWQHDLAKLGKFIGSLRTRRPVIQAS